MRDPMPSIKIAASPRPDPDRTIAATILLGSLGVLVGLAMYRDFEVDCDHIQDRAAMPFDHHHACPIQARGDDGLTGSVSG